MGKKKKTSGAKKHAKKQSRVKKLVKASKAVAAKPAVNVRRLEAEINRLSELLETIKKKSVLVRRSLAYLEREQKVVMRQLRYARSFLLRLKNRGLQALQNFPQTAEDLYDQLKREFNRLSMRWKG